MTEPTAFLARLEEEARVVRTRSAAGAMAWRSWGEGPPLVLLHGGHGSWRHWARNIDRLRHHRRLWVPDLPGMGDSDAAAQPIGRPEVARIVEAALGELLGAERCDLAGFSYGGSIAALVTGAAPERVRTLTLVGSAGFGAVRNPPTVRVAGLHGAERAAAHRRNLHALMIADVARVDDLAAEIQELNTRLYRAKLLPDRQAPYLPGVLDSFAGPVNGIWGARDQFAADLLSQRVKLLRDGRPDSNIRLFEGAGHWVAYEAAEAFDAHLLSRLAGQSRA